MLKGNEILDMPIVAFDTGELLQVIRDLVFDHRGNLLGFLIQEKLWWREAQVLPLHGVKAIGADAIVAIARSAIVKATQVPEMRDALARNLVIAGTRVITEDGRNLGLITDLFFDKKTGIIKGYEVQGGLFGDQAFGYSFVPASENFKIGNDAALVARDTINLMQEKTGSRRLREVVVVPSSPQLHLSAVGSGQGYEAPPTSDHDSSAMAVTSQTSQILSRDNSDGNGQAAESFSHLEQALGRRVRCPVKTEENVYVAALGQIVTPEVLDRARIYHQESELLKAVSGELEEIAFYHATRRLENGLERSQTRALCGRRSRVWLSLQDRVQQTQIQWVRSLEARRIRQVIGRPVNRTILDRRDNVILKVGDPITYGAIETARLAGVVDVLLQSASGPGMKQSPLRTQAEL